MSLRDSDEGALVAKHSFPTALLGVADMGENAVQWSLPMILLFSLIADARG
jgi:hypothetical protein